MDLLLTLGHNSSAIAVKEDTIVCGYEEERLSKIKSDSRFPIKAINRCLKVCQVEEVNRIYVSHWSPTGSLADLSKKHFDYGLLPPFMSLISHHASFTHHDAHANSALWYAYSKSGISTDRTMVLVVDGFGNYGEHISIYSVNQKRQPELVRRFFGYGGSMGLMYQYMTAYLGMKQHEDEYKILGYEAHIDEVDVDRNYLHHEINSAITRYLDGYFDNKQLLDDYDATIRVDALPALQKDYIDRWNLISKRLGLQDADEFTKRVVLGYYVQSVLEGVITYILRIYNPTNLIATGGVFYNVKLSRTILNHIPGKLCVFPLAGDQGNGIGLFVKENGLKWPGHLNWGVRPSMTLKDLAHEFIPPSTKVAYPRNVYMATHMCLEELDKVGMVNVVRGAMEFGPRALCNTSTLALPLPTIVERINKANGRNTIMPMAPVMGRAEYKARMQMASRIHMSEQHMVVALPYRPFAHTDVLGAAHQYKDEFTARPQVVSSDDKLMSGILSSHSVLINTSFNIHGQPIVYDFRDVHRHTTEQNKHEPITTVYMENQDEASS